ncbi:ATP-binding protein [uncultured Sunxiuqinia sp.]|uniref:ATP-binding protein n=1 Tax=uncultured Sunxiuqinia sp. TaxID=1573825 RepID=UPI0030DA7898|tara:strand:+ start:3337 stop:3756 length:420 start_codon:yes stop_codon:yes gene_type:complete
MGNRKTKYFVIENQVGELASLAREIDKLAHEWELSEALAMNINLVIEEALSNIMFYAFADDARHEINLSISVKDNRLTIKITDDGIPFDPLSHKQPDVTLPAEERPVGGLGIFLMSQIMDEMHYDRNKNENILTLNKNI